jgi:imidazolonepropionase-like amidohydrolase
MSVAPVSKAGVGTLTPRKDADIVMLAADRLVAQQRAWRRR